MLDSLKQAGKNIRREFGRTWENLSDGWRELLGSSKEDCRITIEGNLLCLSGEKRFERETGDSTYHIMERAYGSFERTIPLPRNVDTDKAEASYKNGVLCVCLPKVGGVNGKTITVS